MGPSLAYLEVHPWDGLNRGSTGPPRQAGDSANRTLEFAPGRRHRAVIGLGPMHALPIAKPVDRSLRHVVVRVCPICPVRRALAARLVTEIGSYPGVHVETAGGGLGELSVTVDGRSAFRSRGVLTAPSLERILREVRLALAAVPL